MNVIGLKEFREDTARITKRIAAGESFVVLKRSKPIFKLGPVDDDEVWETMIDFTKLHRGGVPIDDLLSRL